jgi:alkyl sulfatase BDS1-like metallo-beta-lactamase superfamily hydrolase
MLKRISVLSLGLLLAACGSDEVSEATATAHTQEAQQKQTAALDFSDQKDFEDARRGFIAAGDSKALKDGKTIWDMDEYAFQNDQPAASTVNPSLWRQAQLNNIHGLFKVVDGIYQVRGYDLGNMSIIDGDKGWIIVDPLTVRQTAATAMKLVRDELGDKPISAVIFTHSHIDHFGGIEGLLEGLDEQPQIIVPEGFMAEATSENVLAGTTMSRRAVYMYGRQLERSPTGHVGSGLGKSPAFGSPGIRKPDIVIRDTGQKLTIDGVDFVFQNVAHSEAPAELTFYLPQKKAFCSAEMVTRTMHNLYTLRGAKVRDALHWSNLINESLQMFGEADVLFASHHWPHWGNDEIVDYLKKQRDLYKYIHDQTLHLAAKGMNAEEIAETIELPESIASEFHTRGYYGTLRHNAKAVYQFYFGWYDANPANLNPLPAVESAARYMELMGGADKVLQAAADAYAEGEYRWAAELLNKLVHADPTREDAKRLLADAYDQLGYQAESGPWRDVYLTAAWELREKGERLQTDLSDAIDMLRATPVPYFFDTMAVMLDGPAAEGRRDKLKLHFTDRDETYLLELENSVLHHRAVVEDTEADISVRLTHTLFLDLLTGRASAADLFGTDDLEIEGGKVALVRFLSLFGKPNPVFNIVTPLEN